jgi:hypothetical protein
LSPRKPFVKRKWHDKGYSGDDICFPQMKELCEGGFPYYKIDSPHMEHQKTEEVPPWEKHS